MLGKLIKHEWKRVWKVPALLLLLLQLIALGAGLTFLKPVFENEPSGIFAVIIGLVWAAFIISIIGVSFAVIIYLALQFYKSMYSDEGYLTHTLPVTGTQLLAAKGLVMGLWSILCTLGIFLSIFVFIVTAANCYPGKEELLIFLRESEEGWNFLLSELRRELELLGIDLAKIIIPFIISAFIGIIYNVALVMGALTIGQLARRYRIAFSFLVGIVISWVISLIQGAIQVPFIFFSISSGTTDNGFYMLGSVWMQNLIVAIAAAVLFIVSSYIIRKKLNLE
ncbi:MAG: hypothetical protein ACI4VG_00735 [Lachnospiraceae bacterium]